MAALFEQICRVDLFVEYPMPFEDLWARSVEVHLERTTVRVASIDDLIVMKRKADEARISQTSRHSRRSLMKSAGPMISEGEARWPVDWESHARTQLRAVLATTPAQWLAWLEEALRFAWKVGALRDPRPTGADPQRGRDASS